MKNRKEKGEKNSTCLNNVLTQKKLQFLLPSSKQIMLVDSSIKYNTGQTQKDKPSSKRNLLTSAFVMNEPEAGKENDGTVARTSINGSLQKQQAKQQKRITKDLFLSIDPNFKVIAQSDNNFNEQIYPSNKIFSSLCIPHDQTSFKYQTSLNNIITFSAEPPIEEDKQASKEELLKRISRLEQLVQDILSGKINVPRTCKSERKLSGSRRESKRDSTSIKLLQQPSKRNKNRSVTWHKQPTDNSSKSLKSKGKLKLKIESAQEKKDFNTFKTPIINPKGFVIKKKNQLKLTSNYQPIRQESDDFAEIRNIPKYVSPIIERNEQSTMYSKLKMNVIFMPNNLISL